ncbi:beta-mannanase [Diplodia corticola]|uniref:Beta-mannanase n=1 Tax=Diplodia corticola TaxID=236234 RepID=A0A1J9SGX3_9PEZI|nr:beta-mannanase [Diplodia corticola]OJD39044.1 beta-mannanase [Diplodia corticola]
MHVAMFISLILTAIIAGTLADIRAVATSAPSAIHRRDSHSWAGSNPYSLHALPAAEQSRYIDTLASWGVQVVRLWGKPSPPPGAFNPCHDFQTSHPSTADRPPEDWVCGRARAMKGLIGASRVEVATGGVGGQPVLLRVHGYMGKAAGWAYFVTGDGSILKAVEAADPGKKVMLEEWGVAEGSEDGFEAQVAVFNGAGLYWQVVPGKDQTQDGAPLSCGYDGFEIGLNSTKGNVRAAVDEANPVSAAQNWAEWFE